VRNSLFEMFELCDSIVPRPCRGKGGASTCERTPMSALVMKKEHELTVLQSAFIAVTARSHYCVYRPDLCPTCIMRDEQGDGPCGAITLPVCFITRDQLAAILLTHKHCLRFDFVINIQITTDIHDHSLDCTGERPGILARIVPCDRLATITPHI